MIELVCRRKTARFAETDRLSLTLVPGEVPGEFPYPSTTVAAGDVKPGDLLAMLGRVLAVRTVEAGGET